MSAHLPQSDDFHQAAERNRHPRVSIFLADSNDSARQLNEYLNRSGRYDLLGKSNSASEVLWRVAEKKPEILLLCLPLTDGSVADLIQQIHEFHPLCGVIVLADRTDNTSVLAALASGARGCLLKDSEPALLRMAITAVSNGGMWLHPDVERLFYRMAKDGVSVCEAPAPAVSFSNANSTMDHTMELSPAERQYIMRRVRQRRAFPVWKTGGVILGSLVLAVILLQLLGRAITSTPEMEAPASAGDPHFIWSSGKSFRVVEMR